MLSSSSSSSSPSSWTCSLLLILATSCGSPTPTCSATAEPYKVCSAGSVWECPEAAADKLAARKAIDDACKQEADPTKCLLNAKYEMFPMTLVARCESGGQKCVESTPAAGAAKSASCQMK